MKYSVVISEILTRSGENNSVTGEARAREHFRGAVATLILSGKFSEEDLLSLHKVIVVSTGSFSSGSYDLSGAKVLKLIDIFIDPVDPSKYSINEIDKKELMRYALRAPSGSKHIDYYQVGKQINILPKSPDPVASLMFEVIVSPPEWKESPESGFWDNDTDMLLEFSFGFLNEAINLAASTLKAEFES